MKYKNKNCRSVRTEQSEDDEMSDYSDGHNRQHGDNRYHFFWRKGSPFSQWHPSRYTLDGVQYMNAEHGMMHGKALLFEDDEVASLIMNAKTPAEIKRLGRQVRGFYEKTWKRHREVIVYRNNVAKFTQNPSLRDALLSTAGGSLVEASPSDRIWGIGLHENDARKTPVNRWPGLNLLGKALDCVRDEIIEGMHDDILIMDPEPSTEASHRDKA